MGIPAFVNSGAFQVKAASTTITPALPASRTNNNVLIAQLDLQLGGASGGPSAPGGGWTIFATDNGGGTSGGDYCALAWRLVDGTEAAPVFSWTGSFISQAQIFQYSGNATPTPIGVSNNAHSPPTTGSATMTAASVTTTGNNSLLIAIFLTSASRTLLSGTNLPPGYVNRAQTGNSSGSNGLADTPVYGTGSATDAISVPIPNTLWNTFLVEILGSGTTANEPAVRASQVVLTVLRTVAGATFDKRGLGNMPMGGI